MSDIIHARTELEHASLSYYLTASDPAATPAAIIRTVDRLEAAGQALAAARSAASTLAAEVVPEPGAEASI